MPKDESLITVTRARYDALVRDAEWLAALEAAGVDNWDGYGYAVDILNDK